MCKASRAEWLARCIGVSVTPHAILAATVSYVRGRLVLPRSPSPAPRIRLTLIFIRLGV